jgi:hypothetical protein
MTPSSTSPRKAEITISGKALTSKRGDGDRPPPAARPQSHRAIKCSWYDQVITARLTDCGPPAILAPGEGRCASRTSAARG